MLNERSFVAQGRRSSVYSWPKYFFQKSVIKTYINKKGRVFSAKRESMTTLNLSDIFFMRAVLPLSEAHRELLDKLVSKGKRSIPDEVSHELSNLCGSRLVTHGFDDYNSPTVEGRKLKELLDKLYT